MDVVSFDATDLVVVLMMEAEWHPSTKYISLGITVYFFIIETDRATLRYPWAAAQPA